MPSSFSNCSLPKFFGLSNPCANENVTLYGTILTLSKHSLIVSLFMLKTSIPKALKISALPVGLVIPGNACLATLIPAAATINEVAVETFIVLSFEPPVPERSVISFGFILRSSFGQN